MADKWDLDILGRIKSNRIQYDSQTFIEFQWGIVSYTIPIPCVHSIYAPNSNRISLDG